MIDKTKEMLSKKKGMLDMGGLLSVLGGIAIIGVAIVMMTVFFSKLKETTSMTAQANATVETVITALNSFTDWFELIVVVAVMAMFAVGGFMIYAYYKRTNGSR